MVQKNDGNNFCQFIETSILNAIKELAKKPEMTKERLQEIARLTLDLIKPEMTVDELYQNMIKIDDQFTELSPTISLVIKEYLEKYQEK